MIAPYNHSEPRLYTGYLTGLVTGSLAYGYLDPIFKEVDMPLADVALVILALGSASIGICFGVLMPKFFPGACFGAVLAVLVGFFDPYYTLMYMPYVYPSLVFIGAMIGIK